MTFFITGTFSTVAQTEQLNNSQNELSGDSINEAVKSKCDALKSLLDLSEKQEYAIMKVLRITEPKKTKIKGTNYEDKVQAKRDLQSIMGYEIEKFEQILSESQFKLYSDSLKMKG